MKLRFSDGYSTAVEFESATDYEVFKANLREALNEFQSKTGGRIAHLHLWNGRMWYNVRSNRGLPNTFSQPVVLWGDATDEWMTDAFGAIEQTILGLSKTNDFFSTFMDVVQSEVEIESEMREAVAAFIEMFHDEEMTPAEISQEFGVAVTTIRESVRKGYIPARKSGKTVLIKRSDAEARWGKRMIVCPECGEGLDKANQSEAQIVYKRCADCAS